MSGGALLDELLDPLAQCLDMESSRRIVQFGITPSFQQKVDVLAERANEGTLTDEERADYESLINATDFISILKQKALRRLTSDSRP